MAAGPPRSVGPLPVFGKEATTSVTCLAGSPGVGGGVLGNVLGGACGGLTVGVGVFIGVLVAV